MTSEIRPPVWIGHVAMHTDLIAESSEFMQLVGMRMIASGDEFAVLEMRGGTHLVLTTDPESQLVKGGFDLMVEDLEATHARFTELGLAPGEIGRGQIHDCFEVREPGGTNITFNSSHVGELPV
jgi:acyl-coenzyme A thioesterase PaaI-like protein